MVCVTILRQANGTRASVRSPGSVLSCHEELLGLVVALAAWFWESCRAKVPKVSG
jgi:hypothetical protein